MVQFSYHWYYADSWPTSHGLQGHLHFSLYASTFAMLPVCSIFGRPCVRTYKAKEGALIHALLYTSDVLGYTIGDVYYTDYVMAHNNQ